MEKSTKKAIKEAYISLLEERPASRVTVRDIVSRCGINRNSFYYHYADLPSLIEELMHEQTIEIIKENPDSKSTEDYLSHFVEYIMSNKKALMHVYSSISRETFDTYLMEICDYIVRSCLEALSIAPDDNLQRKYRGLFFGLTVEWFSHGLSDDVYECILAIFK